MFKLNCMEAKLLFRLRGTSRLLCFDAESRLRGDTFCSMRDCSREHKCCEWDFGFRFSFPRCGGKTGECLLSHQQTLIFLCFLLQRRGLTAPLSTSSQRTTRSAPSRWKLWTRFEMTLSTSSRREWIWRSRATMLSRIAWKWRRQEFEPDRASLPKKKSR